MVNRSSIKNHIKNIDSIKKDFFSGEKNLKKFQLKV